jgi:hypothetical protein
VAPSRLSLGLYVCLLGSSLSSGLGLGWPVSFGFVVGLSPTVWPVSVLVSSPQSASMWFSASASVLGSALALALA